MGHLFITQPPQPPKFQNTKQEGKGLNINSKFHPGPTSPRLCGHVESLQGTPGQQRTCQRRLRSGLLLRRRPPLGKGKGRVLLGVMVGRGGGPSEGPAMSFLCFAHIPFTKVVSAPSTLPPLALGWTPNKTPVHADRLSHQILAVESLHCSLGLLVCFILNESIPLGQAKDSYQNPVPPSPVLSTLNNVHHTSLPYTPQVPRLLSLLRLTNSISNVIWFQLCSWPTSATGGDLPLLRVMGGGKECNSVPSGTPCACPG